MLTEAITREHQPTSPPNMEDTILKDFHLSFKFSQGRPMLQRSLLIAIATKYPKEEFCRQFPTADVLDTRLYSRVQKLRPPMRHTKNTVDSAGEVMPFNIPTEVDKEWKGQLTILGRMLLGEVDLEETIEHSLMNGLQEEGGYEKLLEKITGDMATRDLAYLQNGRPQRTADEDRYESYLRTYALEGRPTGSPRFNALFEEIGEIIRQVAAEPEKFQFTQTTMTLFEPLMLLREKWEEHFPAKKFLTQKMLEKD